MCWPEGKGWYHPSIMSVFHFEALLRYTVKEKDHDGRAFSCVAVTCRGRDLVEEYLSCGIWPLSRGWSIGPIV